MKQTVSKYIFATLCLFASLAVHANETLLPFVATLEATRFGTFDLNLDGKMYLKTNGNQWEFGLNAKKGAIATDEVSKGKLLANNKYQPNSYEKKSHVFLIKENIDWNYDWIKNTVKGKVKKDKIEHTLHDNLYDPLSYQLALRQQLKAGQLQLSVDNLRYKNPETFQFAVIGEELLEINGTLIMTKIVKQLKPQRGDSKYLIWVAPEFDYITLRFASYSKGKLKDLVQVTSLSINGQASSF
ncbi:DUF3108 domain-containing protein [Reinekea sp.]|jgi:hypothetical protein|uniref:DUF3108 domain-containing protein n=1 Tax=Reinekea sp. TaxID=1970455 RepID=UPI00398988B1